MAKPILLLNYILELSKHLNVDPRSAVDIFFARMQEADPEFIASFDGLVETFIERNRRSR